MKTTHTRRVSPERAYEVWQTYDGTFTYFVLKKYKLTDPALLLLGEIVRAADSHPSNPHPAGEGLRNKRSVIWAPISTTPHNTKTRIRP